MLFLPLRSFRVVGLQENGHQDSNSGVRRSTTVLQFLTQCLLQGITFSKPGLTLKVSSNGTFLHLSVDADEGLIARQMPLYLPHRSIDGMLRDDIAIASSYAHTWHT